MLRKAGTLALAGVFVVTTTIGCSNMGDTVGTKTVVGGLGGAAAGGLIGAAAGGGGKGIAAGVILGGLLGGAVGNVLDQRDRKLAQQAAQKSLESAPSGSTTAWKNPDNGNSGTVTPNRTYQTANGQYCREYTQTINVGGKKQTSYGTACRQPDGQWKIVS
jgi:surface antigen